MAGKRIRRFFSEEAAALAWADDFERRIKERGIAGIEDAGGMLVNDAVRRFFASRDKAVTGDNARLYHFWLSHFCEFIGSTPIASITALDLERFWARKQWAPNTRRQALAYLRAFFGWCERHDLVAASPARKVDVPAPTKPARAILTPEQMSSLLGAAGTQMRAGAQMLAGICLGGFAGLRTSEIIRSKLEIDVDEIHIEDGKTGGRYVAVLPVFARFWPGEFVRPDPIAFARFLPGEFIQPDYRTFRRHRSKLIKSLGWKEWPANCLRHSFASYHLAMWEDAGKTAYQLGHTSPQMVYKAYARAVKKADAVRWWSLRP